MELIEGYFPIGSAELPTVQAVITELESIGNCYDVTIQAFNSRYIVSRHHLERALVLADRERAKGEGIADDRGVEVLLYAAGRRQIDQAMELGIHDRETPAVVLCDGDGEEKRAAHAVRELMEPADTLGAFDRGRVQDFFDISSRELSSTALGIESLVLERVALLVVER